MRGEISRRQCLHIGSTAFGSLAWAALQGHAQVARGMDRAPDAARLAPRAKRVIFLFMNGGPSQHDMFDYKPELAKRSGQTGRDKKKPLIGPITTFAQHGNSGQWISDFLPHLANQADQLCVIRSMQTNSSAHPLAIPLLHTGSFQFTRPSMGSWILYGLGTENKDLPGYISINPTRTFGGPSNYGSAFLPSNFQATRIGWQGKSLRDATIENIGPDGAPTTTAKRQVELSQMLNRSLLARGQAIHSVRGALDSLDLSLRMEAVVPHVMNLGEETVDTLSMYGIDQKPTDNFARQCLLARRFAEAGVRFIQLTHGGWDHHSNLNKKLPDRCADIDKPIAALLTDLKQRGMLEDTLVLWIGEFGRQPDTQILNGKLADGRDHNAKGYCAWLAGGGVREGISHGATDELGYEAVENQVHLYDLQATILHLVGLDHTKLTYRYSGRDFRLTDVHGQVVHDILT